MTDDVADAIVAQVVAGLDDGGPPRELIAWARRYLSHHFNKPMSRLHRYLAEEFDRIGNERGSHTVIVAPRGSAKTTWILAYVLQSICEESEPFILIVADTGPQACEYLDAVKAELEANERLADDYPNAVGKGRTWAVQKIRTRNNVQVVAAGTGFALRGRKKEAARPTLVIVDDPEGEKHRDSPAEREKAWKWLNGTLMPIGYTGRTNYVIAGTALHRECMVLRLLKTAGWRGRQFASIEGLPDQMDMVLWAEWEAIYADEQNDGREVDARRFYDANREKLDRGAVILWPEEEDLYALMCFRATIGHFSFELEKQSNAVSPETVEWPSTYFGSDLWFDEWPRDLIVRVIAWDPAKGRHAKRGSYSAIVLYGVGPREHGAGLLYVEADLARRPVEQRIHDLIELARRFRPDVIVIEAVQFQELLIGMVERACAEQGLILPIEPIETGGVPKPVRIRRLGPYLARRAYRFKSRSSSTQLLLDHLQDFPGGSSDDGPDAMEMAQRAAVERFNQQFLADDGLGQYLEVGV